MFHNISTNFAGRTQRDSICAIYAKFGSLLKMLRSLAKKSRLLSHNSVIDGFWKGSPIFAWNVAQNSVLKCSDMKFSTLPNPDGWKKNIQFLNGSK